MNDYSENRNQHLNDELTRIYLKLSLAIKKFRSNKKALPGAENFFGLFISEEEIDDLLTEKSFGLGLTDEIRKNDPEVKSIEKAINNIEKNIKKKTEGAIKKGIVPDTIYLADLFSLTPEEMEIFLICLAAEVDLQYGKLFAYLQDDITMKYPSVDLILNLVVGSYEAKLRGREYFQPSSPLFKYKFLEFVDERQSKSLLSQQCKVNDRIMGFLFGRNSVDTQLSSVAELYTAEHTLDSIVIPDELKGPLKNFLTCYKNEENQKDERYILSFYGNYGSGKKETASAIAGELGLPLLIIDLAAVNELNIPLDNVLHLALRESLLLPAILYFKNADILFNSDEQIQLHKKQLVQGLLNNFFISFIDSSEPLNIYGELTEKGIIEIDFQMPGFEKRINLWNTHIDDNYKISDDCIIDEIAGKFNFSNGQISDSLKIAFNSAFWNDPADPVINSSDMLKGCHTQSNQKLKALAQKIIPKNRLNDIILPKDLKRQLDEIINSVLYKHKVYGDWGFEQKLTLGKGLNVLISGVPGTGKTMASEIISNELSLDLYKIDISTVVSKYIGETEKNLSRIFREAESSNSVLFFDEADALFGKRSDVNDSHDRYANIETGYLLQKMEEFSGIVILATNLKNNMDDAFMRRMHFAMEFPFPDSVSRALIWQNIFPEQTPCSNLDFQFLAEQFKISGGNIKNIALAAAFFAAAANEKVEMKHIIPAIRREYQKMGKLCVKDEFGEYFDLIG